MKPLYFVMPIGLFFLILITYGTASLIFKAITTSVQTYDWIPTQGIVDETFININTKKDNRAEFNIVYSYSVADSTYSSCTIMQEEDHKQIEKSDYSPQLFECRGKPITVYYDPDNPANCKLVSCGEYIGNLLLAIILVLSLDVLFLIGFGIVLYCEFVPPKIMLYKECKHE